MKRIMLVVSAFFLAAGSIAAPPVEPSKDSNCAQIFNACLAAGFVVGEAKEGKGLWMDCVNPIMQGTVAKKSVLPLPSVPSGVISGCKAAHPKYGQGKIGN